MKDLDAKKVALAAVRRRFNTGLDAAIQHVNDNWQHYAGMDAVSAAFEVSNWLEQNRIGPSRDNEVTLKQYLAIHGALHD